jgi:hypothetical protein
MQKYLFVYFRTSPRKNSKFGITHLPWERLRMFQQGTDEEVQFDHLWLMKSKHDGYIEIVENALKNHYNNKCLFNQTNRSGHTEWFKNLDFKDFEKNLLELSDLYGIEVQKISMKKPYVATRGSECPFRSPNGKGKYSVQDWAGGFWQVLREGKYQF